MSQEDDQIDNFKKDRQQFVVELRKQQRFQLFQLKRKFTDYQEDIDEKSEPEKVKRYLILDEELRPEIERYMQEIFYEEEIDDFCIDLCSSDCILRQHEAIIGIRKLISESQNKQMVQKVLFHKIIPTLLKMVKQEKYLQIKLEACWIYTNIASTVYCEQIISQESIKIFVQLLQHSVNSIRIQSLWALGNISGDNAAFRDLIIQEGGVALICKIIENSQSIRQIRQATWTLSNLCRGLPYPNIEKVELAIPVMCKTIISGVLDSDTLTDSLWALCYFSEGKKAKLMVIVKTGVAKNLIEIAKEESRIQTLIASLRVIGNITIGNQVETQEIIKYGGLELIETLLKHQRKSIRRQACWILSNIAAGTKAQVEKIISKKKIIQTLKNLLETDSEDVKNQIYYVLSNMCYVGNKLSIFDMINDYRLLETLINSIQDNDSPKNILTFLETVDNYLSIGNSFKNELGQNSILKAIKKIPNALAKIQSFQYHENVDIYNKLLEIFEKYFITQVFV